MEAHHRNRESVEEVQQKILSVETRGIARREGRKQNAEAFAHDALEYIQSALANNQLPYTILPQYSEIVMGHFHELLLVQHMAVSKSLNDNLTGTIFDKPTMTVGLEAQWREYVTELLSVALENVTALKGDDANGFRQALYRDADWLVQWLDGTLVRNVLEETQTYSKQQVEEFLREYNLDHKLRNMRSNIKNPGEAVLKIAHNYFTVLSDENIKEILHGRDAAEIAGFLTRFTKSYRMDFSVRHIVNPAHALEIIAAQNEDLLKEGTTKELLWGQN